MDSKKIYFETYGCTMNQSDSEYIVQSFLDHKFRMTDYDESDFVLINTCGVKKSTEDKIIARLRFLSSTDKKVIVSGCLPKINLDRIINAVPNYYAIFDTNIQLIREKIPSILENNGQIIDLSTTKDEKIHYRSHNLNPYRSIISISEGCVGNCTYCCAKNARGVIKSYDMDKIVQRIKQDLSLGIREFYLTGQDLSSYGLDLDMNLANLIQLILSVDGDFRIRLGMMNPDTLSPILDQLIELYSDRRLYKFIHIPLQSGSDRILQLMNRNYTSNEYISIIRKIRSKISNLNLWTDVIVGFPTESEDDFQATLNLIKEIRPEKINLSKYGVRPNTKAAKMTQVDSKTVKRRSKELNDLYLDLSGDLNKEYLNKEIEVLFTEKNEKYYGRSNNFSRVITKEATLGEFQRVKIKKVDRLNLFC